MGGAVRVRVAGIRCFDMHNGTLCAGTAKPERPDCGPESRDNRTAPAQPDTSAAGHTAAAKTCGLKPACRPAEAQDTTQHRHLED